LPGPSSQERGAVAVPAGWVRRNPGDLAAAKQRFLRRIRSIPRSDHAGGVGRLSVAQNDSENARKY